MDAESEITNIQALVAESRRRGNEVLEDIIAKVTTGKINALEALLLAYKRETGLLTTHSEMLDEIYECELQFLMRTNSSTLSQFEKTKLTEEVDLLSKTLSFGLKSGKKSFFQ